MADPGFNLNPLADGFNQDVAEAFDEVVRTRFFATADGPNQSGVTAARGTLGIETNSSATTTLWVQTSDGTDNWVGLA